MKILIVRFSSIGDIVLTSPVIRVAKQQINAEVHYLTKNQYSSLLKYNPYISKIYSIEKNINEVVDKLKLENYDFIIDLHNSLRSKILKSKLRVKSFTVNKANIKKLLMVKFKLKNLFIPHIVERYLDTLNAIGGTNDGQGLDYFYPHDDSLFLKFNIYKSYTCISIGAKHFTKQIPTELIINTISQIDNNIVLIGGKDVIYESKEIEKSTKTPIINLVGKISISQSAQIIENSEAILTSDTGMMHIAAALKKKTVVVWGNTIPEFGMYPYFGNHKVETTNIEVEGLKCRPCSKIGYKKCPKSHFKCMKEHSALEIANKLKLNQSDSK